MACRRTAGSGGRTSIAQSYRFLRMVLNTAVREGLMVRNPCMIPGAGVVRASERPVAWPAEVTALVEADQPAVPRGEASTPAALSVVGVFAGSG